MRKQGGIAIDGFYPANDAALQALIDRMFQLLETVKFVDYGPQFGTSETWGWKIKNANSNGGNFFSQFSGDMDLMQIDYRVELVSSRISDVCPFPFPGSTAPWPFFSMQGGASVVRTFSPTIDSIEVRVQKNRFWFSEPKSGIVRRYNIYTGSCASIGQAVTQRKSNLHYVVPDFLGVRAGLTTNFSEARYAIFFPD